jgi:TolB-like protein/tetratricopeptide (TPR) repeat protein
MAIWSSEIKELEKLYASIKGQLPDLEKELERLIKADDENMILLYSRRCLEVIITDLCECELKRPRKTEPLQGIIDKLHKEEKVPSHIIASMHGLNELATYGAHPKDFDLRQVRTTLINLDTIIEWYLKHKEGGAEVVERSAEGIRQEAKSTEDIKKRIQIPRKRLTSFITGSILLIVIVVAVLFFTDIIGGDKKIQEIDKSIAVLPFKSLSDDPDKQYLADGMMDAILLHLSKIKDLRVMSRTSVEQYRKTDKTLNVIGKELDVAYLLEGSFQKYGDNARLIVQLIKTGKEGHVWANDYDRNWNSVFSVQSEVAQNIAKELHTVITPEVKRLIEKIPTSDTTAYLLYLKANDYRIDYQKTRDLSSYQTAVNLYKAALEIDSAFAKAYTGLASAYYNRYQWETYFKENYMDSMQVLVDKALDIDDQLDEAYYLKGRYYQANGRIEEALESFDKALKINPNYYLPYFNKGYLFSFVLGDYINGLDNYHKALNIVNGDERQNVLSYLGRAYLDAGFIDKAKYYYQEGLTLSGNEASYFGNLAFIEFNLENFEEALKLAKKMNGIDSTYLHALILYSVPPGHNEEAYIHANKLVENFKKRGALNLVESHRVGYALWQVGKKKEAENYFNQQIKYDEESIKRGRDIEQWDVAYYDMAGTYAFLGEKEKAYKYLDEFDKKNTYGLWWVSLAKHDPLFASIRNEERFQKILQNMERKYLAEHERVKKWLEEQGML